MMVTTTSRRLGTTNSLALIRNTAAVTVVAVADAVAVDQWEAGVPRVTVLDTGEVLAVHRQGLLMVVEMAGSADLRNLTSLLRSIRILVCYSSSFCSSSRCRCSLK